MTLGATRTAMQAKLGLTRALEAVNAMTLPRAWRLSLVHGLNETVRLPVTLESHDTRPVAADEMADLSGEGDLAVLLEGAGGFAVAIIEAQLLAAMLEAQTMGRVLARPAAPRTPTQTDGAMVADPLDRVLELFERHAAAIPGTDTAFGMRYATMLADGLAMTLSLPDEEHVLSEMVLGLGASGRRGVLRLILPRERPVEVAAPRSDDSWAEGIERNVMAATAELRAVLFRLHRPIETVTGLQAGDMIVIPASALGQVALTSCTGSVVARGRLGQKSGTKAVLLELDSGEGALPAESRPLLR